MTETLFKRRTADKLLMLLGMLTQCGTEDKARRLLQAWMTPYLLAGFGLCQWKSREEVIDHLKEIGGGLDKLNRSGLIEVPESKKYSDCITTRFESIPNPPF